MSPVKGFQHYLHALPCTRDASPSLRGTKEIITHQIEPQLVEPCTRHRLILQCLPRFIVPKGLAGGFRFQSCRVWIMETHLDSTRLRPAALNLGHGSRDLVSTVSRSGPLVLLYSRSLLLLHAPYCTMAGVLLRRNLHQVVLAIETMIGRDCFISCHFLARVDSFGLCLPSLRQI